ncbi:hypothetical protein [Actinocorallia longicatena]|uniref:Secreted protein n=1 Tax=Actinocorallia longicatena TaxID=111803 RepID=A0ABP6QPG7_9ACTN
MRQTRQLAAAVAMAATALAVGAPAHAATTTVKRVPGGTAYSGAVQALLLGTATVSTSIGSGSCNSSTMTGSVNSNGTGLSIASATFAWTPSPPGPGCQGSTTSTVTSQNTPWTGGNVTYAPVSGGRDATVTIANFRVKAVVNLFGGITCIYGGTIVANGFNGTNPARPVPGNGEAQAGLSGATVNKISSGSSFLCPGTATVSGTYQLKGEVTAGSGVFNQSLQVTA